MPDDRKQRGMTDADRALSRRKTVPRGVPEFVEPEVTPPPQDPPRPDTLRGFESIPPPIKDQLNMLADGLGQVTAALGRRWDQLDGKRWDRLEDNIASIATSVTRHETILAELRPQLDRWRAVTDELAQQLPKLVGALEGLTLHVRSIDSRMRDLELEVRALTERTRGHRDDLDGHREREAEIIKRISSLETIESNRTAADHALAMAGLKKSGLVGSAAGAVVTAIGWLAQHFI